MTLFGRLWRTQLLSVTVLVGAALAMGLVLGCIQWRTGGDLLRSPGNAFVLGFMATLTLGAVPALVGGGLHALLAHQGWMRWWLSTLVGAGLGGVFLLTDATLGLWTASFGAVCASVVHWKAPRIRVGQ